MRDAQRENDARLKAMFRRQVFSDNEDNEGYKFLADDLARMATIQAIVHLMMVADGSEPLGGKLAVKMLMYTLTGVLVYHLIIRMAPTAVRATIRRNR